MAVGDKLFVADKQTLDAVKTLIGTSGDAAGIATVFARLAQIAGYVDTLETNLGSNSSSASATGDVHAKIKELRTLVDTVESTLGTIGTNVNTIKSNTTSISVIKSVQRGQVEWKNGVASQNQEQTITISPINVNKATVNLYGAGLAQNNSEANRGFFVSNLTSTSLSIKFTNGLTDTCTISWEIVEFY